MQISRMPTIIERLWDMGMHRYYKVHGFAQRNLPHLDELWHRGVTHALFALETPIGVVAYPISLLYYIMLYLRIPICHPFRGSAA